MHTITFVPQRRDDPLTALSWSGDVLTIDGQTIDLSGVTEGSSLPASAVAHPLIAGAITRTSGNLDVPLYLPVDANRRLSPDPIPPVASAATVAIPEPAPETPA